jgi:hypothetical protein
MRVRASTEIALKIARKMEMNTISFVVQLLLISGTDHSIRHC